MTPCIFYLLHAPNSIPTVFVFFYFLYAVKDNNKFCKNNKRNIWYSPMAIFFGWNEINTKHSSVCIRWCIYICVKTKFKFTYVTSVFSKKWVYSAQFSYWFECVKPFYHCISICKTKEVNIISTAYFKRRFYWLQISFNTSVNLNCLQNPKQ